MRTENLAANHAEAAGSKAGSGDWKLPELLRADSYRAMLELRDFEREAYDLFVRGLVHGTSQLSLGHEAIAVGSVWPCGART